MHSLGNGCELGPNRISTDVTAIGLSAILTQSRDLRSETLVDGLPGEHGPFREIRIASCTKLVQPKKKDVK